jgi:hypothetical protein
VAVVCVALAELFSMVACLLASQGSAHGNHLVNLMLLIHSMLHLCKYFPGKGLKEKEIP